jgi:hypothetical protein
VANSGAMHHTTPSVGNISTLHPLNLSNPSSIIVGNGSALPITSVGDLVIPGPFYLNNILVAPDIVQSLLSIRCFTTNNWCSMEFDLLGLSVKDLPTKNVIVRSNSTDPLYTMRLPESITLSSSAMAALAATPPPSSLPLSLQPRVIVVSIILVLMPYLACLCHPLFNVPAVNTIFVMHVSWVNTPGYLLVAHHIVQNTPLISYILIIGHLLLLVCRVLSIIWSFLMILLITYRLFP